MRNPSQSRKEKLAHFLGLQRSTVGVYAMVVLVGMGEHMGERFLPIYLFALGGGALTVGLLQGMDNLLSALYSFPGGYLADRIGSKRALQIFNIIAMAGFATVALFSTWQAVLIGAALFISWSALSMPATLSLIYRVVPTHKRTMGVSVHSLLRRFPMALGPLAGGFFISIFGEQDGVRLAFVGAFVLAGVAAILQQQLIEPDTTENSARKLLPEGNPLKLLREMSPALKRLLISDTLIRFCEQIPYAFVVIWCMKEIANPVTAWQFGVLTTIEMATAVLIYIPVAHWADRGEKKPFVFITFVFFAMFPIVLMYSQSFNWLILAFVIRGLKEFGEPTRKSLIMDLSPEHCRAGMFGLYYLIRDSVVSIAAIGGAFLWLISPQINFLVATGFGIIGFLAFALLVKSDSKPFPNVPSSVIP